MSLIQSGTTSNGGTATLRDGHDAAAYWQVMAATATAVTLEFQDTHAVTQFTVTIPSTNTSFVNIPVWCPLMKVTGAQVSYMAYG